MQDYIIEFNVSRDIGKVKIIKIFVSKYDYIKKEGDLILTYEVKKYFGLKKEVKEYFSDKDGVIKDMDISSDSKISKEDIY